MTGIGVSGVEAAGPLVQGQSRWSSAHLVASPRSAPDFVANVIGAAIMRREPGPRYFTRHRPDGAPGPL